LIALAVRLGGGFWVWGGGGGGHAHFRQSSFLSCIFFSCLFYLLSLFFFLSFNSSFFFPHTSRGCGSAIFVFSI
jgi:hypothetical protein